MNQRVDIGHPIDAHDVVVLRVRKGTPGIGRKLGTHFMCNEVTCNVRPHIRVREGATVLNYGRSDVPVWFDPAIHKFINHPDAVKKCIDKRLTLSLLTEAGISCLDSTVNKEEAQGWLDNGDSVIVRHIVNGKQGKGVELVRPRGVPLPHAPLYTKFYDKTHEFRVHVVNGVAVDYVQKKMWGKKRREKEGLKEVDMLTRNRKKGWVFAHKDLLQDGQDQIKDIAVRAVQELGLDYGGVDMLAQYNGEEFIGSVVCEVNSAPGMFAPTTFKAYTEAFRGMMK